MPVKRTKKQRSTDVDGAFHVFSHTLAVYNLSEGLEAS